MSNTNVTAHKPRIRKEKTVWIITAVVIVALFLLLGLPASKLVESGTSSGGIDAIVRAVTVDRSPLWNTLLLGTLVGLVGTVVGFVTAYAQVFLDFKGKKLLHWLTLLPMISPPFAVATATITLFGRRGIVSHGIFGLDIDIYGLSGLTLVIAMTFTPIAYMNVRGMLENLDPSLFEASYSLGASELKTLFKVTLPMVLPALLTSFLLLFVEGIADLANPLVLGGDFRVLASQIYFAVAGSGNIAAAAGIALLLLLPALTVFVIQKYWAGKKSVATITGKPTGRRKPVTSLAVKIPILTVAFIWMILIALIYLTVFFGGFTNIIGVDNTPTLEHYAFVKRLGSDAMVTTMWMTIVAAPIAAVLAICIAWLVVRHFRRFGKVLDFIGMLGTAIPGTVLGLGFALAYSQPTWLFGKQILPPLAGGLSVGAGAVAVVMVYVARGIPTGQQSTISALKQINPQIEEASTSLGASSLTTFLKVTIPLISPAIITGLTYAITKSMTTITAIIFITTPQTKVMTSQILDEVDAGRFGNAFAYCTVLILLVLVVLGITSFFLNKVNRSRRAK